MDDIDQHQIYINDVSRFLERIKSHIIGLDASGLREVETSLSRLTQIWTKSYEGLDKLLAIDDSLRLMNGVAAFVVAVDVGQIARAMDISDTSRGVLAMNKRDILSFGSRYADSLHAIANHILAHETFTPANVEHTLTKAHFPLGPIMSKLARRYTLLLPPTSRDYIVQLLLGTRLDKFLGTSYLAIDAGRRIYEQILTFGQLIPKMNTKPICEIETILCSSSPCNYRYPTREELIETLTRISEKRDVSVIFISSNVMGGERVIEFDGRLLFDAAYVMKEDLLLSGKIGLCEKHLRRFATTREIDYTTDTPNFPNYLQIGTGNRVLVIESLAPSAFRCLGLPRKMFIEPANCQFLIRGQSNRAQKYHEQCEAQILSLRGSDKIRVAVSTFNASSSKVNSCVNLMITETMRANITRELTAFLAGLKNIWSLKPGEIFIFCAKVLRDLLPTLASRSVHREAMSMFYSRMMSLANRINSLIREHGKQINKICGPEFARQRDNVVAEIIKKLDDESFFVVSESLNMMYLRMI